MATTFAGQLADGQHRNLRLAVEVQGLPYVLCESLDDVPPSTRTSLPCLVEVQQGEQSLDLVRRRQTGGSLTLTLQEDGAGLLRALFAPRARRLRWVTANESETDTTLSVNSSTGLTVGVAYYVDAETVTFTGTGATTLTGCTRGAYGSEPQRHNGASDTGAGVFAAPPSWIGRRVSLLGYFANADPNANQGAMPSTTLHSARIVEAPAYVGDGRWELRCEDISAEIASRRIGIGYTSAECGPPNESGGSFAFALREASALTWTWPATGGLGWYARVESPDGAVGVGRVASVVAGVVNIVAASLRGAARTVLRQAARAGGESTWRLTPLTLLGEYDARDAIVSLAVSRIGDYANSAYDVLTGADAGGYGEPTLRTGAGILAAYVDSAAILALPTNGQWPYVVDDEKPFEDALADFCLCLDLVWLVGRDGKLTMRSLADDTGPPSTTIDSHVVIGAPTVTYDEETIFPRVSLACGYNVVTGKLDDVINIVDSEMAALYPARQEALKIESRTLRLATARRSGSVPVEVEMPSVSLDDIKGTLRRLQRGGGRGRLFVDVTCSAAVLDVELGAVVSLTLSGVPALDGGTIAALTRCRVVSRRPDYRAGTVQLRLQTFERQWYIGGAAIVASVAAGPPYTITLATNQPEGGGLSPGLLFGVGWAVRVWDISGNDYSDVEVSAVTATTVELGAAPVGVISGLPLAIVAGDVVSAVWDPSVTSPVNANGLAPSDHAHQVPDNERNAWYTSSVLPSRWS